MAPRAQKGSSRSFDPTRYWRPRSRKGGICGYTFDGDSCQRRGAHYCQPRADKVVAFFAELLVHTKGPWARRAFTLADWQEHDIVRPLFGEVIWSEQWKCYVRRYRIAYIALARKNGKSELAAGILLYLLVGDDEDAAEVYGAAKDTKQARKVWEPAERMRALSPLLSKRLGVNKNEKRIYDERSASWYEIITADASGELGHNPHAFVLDEVLSQLDGMLWEAMVTAEGARLQPLYLAITTETNKPGSFGAELIDEAERIQEDPGRAPHAFAYVRKLPKDDEALDGLHRLFPDHPDLPVSTDPFDEGNWRWPNPALDTFLDREALRRAATEARNQPEKENGFRQFRCNQRVSQVTRWMPLHLWDASRGLVVPEQLKGRTCFAGLDLASTTDLAAWVLLFPGEPNEPLDVLWRFWTPEAQLPFLDRHTGGQASQWAKGGLLKVTEGDWIDYFNVIHPAIEADKQAYRIVKVGYDQKEATATAQFMQGLGLDIDPVTQGYALSGALKELMRLVKAKQLRHGGHPVARYCADSAEVRRDDMDRIKLVKPDRHASGKRIDGLAAAGNAIHVWQAGEVEEAHEPWFAHA
jgi:phage terminase large subunit-like protein